MNPATSAADLPSDLPYPPDEAGQWSADRLGAAGWEPMHSPSGSEGGRPTRWHDLPCDVSSKWGPGVYRVHWRTAGRRPLGTSEPFRQEAGALPPTSAQQQPLPPVAAPPSPAPSSPEEAQLHAFAQQVAAIVMSQLPKADKPKADKPTTATPATADFVVLEQISHSRQREILEHHKLISESQDRAFQLYLGRVDERDRLHQAELDKLRTTAAAQIQELAEHARQREETLAGALAETRAELSQVTDRVEELAEQPEPQPTDENQKPLGQLLRIVGPERISQLVDVALHYGAQQLGIGQAPALPSPTGGVGGSVGG